MRIIELLLMHFQHVKARCIIKRLKAQWDFRVSNDIREQSIKNSRGT